MPRLGMMGAASARAFGFLRSAIASAVDEYFNRTTLLLNTSSTNGAQNNTFLDSSTNNFTITRNGNTTQGTFTPFSQTGWSNYFNGSQTSPSLSFPSNAAYSLGSTADFTVEMFVNFTNGIGSEVSLVERFDGTSGPGWIFGKSSGDKFWVGFGGSTYPCNTSLVANRWYHLCWMRTGGNSYLFVDGVLDRAAITTANFTDGSSPLSLGERDGIQTFPLTGYMSNVRIVKGTAVYSTSGFTVPTTALTSVTNTSLLTCQSNRFVDNSVTAAVATVGAASSVQAFSPFAPTAAYDTAVVGGSGYFDGSGDYLTSTITAVSNTTMTMECWIYNTALDNTNGNHYIMVNNGANANYALTHDGSGKARYVSRNNTGGAIFDLSSATGVLKLNQWHHIVGVRTSGNASLYVDGVRVATTASPTTSTTDGTSLYISSNAGTGRMITGWMSSARIVSGTAVYDPTLSTLTVPTAPLTSVTNTRLLLNFTNAGIYDSTSKSTWETVGNVQVSTAQSKWGGTSIYVPGSSTNQRLLPSQNYPFDIFGTGDFTIECWLYVISQGATNVGGLWDQRPGVNGTYINWVVDFGGYSQGSPTNPKLVLYTNSAAFVVSGVLTMGTWNHVALCRASGTTRMFINGTLSGTAVSDTNNYLGGGSAGNYRPSIGSTDGGDSLYGYIDDFRATRYARYTTNFTAPTAAFGTQ